MWNLVHHLVDLLPIFFSASPFFRTEIPSKEVLQHPTSIQNNLFSLLSSSSYWLGMQINTPPPSESVEPNWWWWRKDSPHVPSPHPWTWSPFSENELPENCFPPATMVTGGGGRGGICCMPLLRRAVLLIWARFIDGALSWFGFRFRAFFLFFFFFCQNMVPGGGRTNTHTGVAWVVTVTLGPIGDDLIWFDSGVTDLGDFATVWWGDSSDYRGASGNDRRLRNDLNTFPGEVEGFRDADSRWCCLRCKLMDCRVTMALKVSWWILSRKWWTHRKYFTIKKSSDWEQKAFFGQDSRDIW